MVILQALCRYADGTNSVTGVETRKSLGKALHYCRSVYNSRQLLTHVAESWCCHRAEQQVEYMSCATRSPCDELLQGVAPDGALRRQALAALKALRYVGSFLTEPLALHILILYKNSTNTHGAACSLCWHLSNETFEVCTPVRPLMLSASC